ncbi:hypothetical protein EYF80_041792 [Liparis tanakae]|uniref:Uncharacterized protein n=1 Tax=Liparis tanakae TaxID=230148 RepID=A0A4Z2G494_9TELE|nr:hypothetical protein EYF80_041792 [Liparis tanakae]
MQVIGGSRDPEESWEAEETWGQRGLEDLQGGWVTWVPRGGPIFLAGGESQMRRLRVENAMVLRTDRGALYIYSDSQWINVRRRPRARAVTPWFHWEAVGGVLCQLQLSLIQLQLSLIQPSLTQLQLSLIHMDVSV